MNKNKVQQRSCHIELNSSNVSDKQLLSGTFNNYFVERLNNIHTSIPNSASHYHDLIPTIDTTMSFVYATVEEVLETITSMKKQNDFDDVPTNILKLSREFVFYELVIFLTYALIKVFILTTWKLLWLFQSTNKALCWTWKIIGQYQFTVIWTKFLKLWYFIDWKFIWSSVSAIE